MVRKIRQPTAAKKPKYSQALFVQVLRDSLDALTKTLNLEDVLDQIMANVGKVVKHEAVSLMLLENEQVRLVRSLIYSPEGKQLELPPIFQMKLAEVPNLVEIVRTGEPLIIANISDSPGWLDFPQTRWIKSYVGAPISSQGEIFGFLNLVSTQPDAFSAEDARHLMFFADQAAVAIRNARLYEMAQQRSEQAVLMNEITSALNQPNEEPGILQTAVDHLAAALKVAYVGIALQDETGSSLRFVADHAVEGYSSLVGLELDIKGTWAANETEPERKVIYIADALGKLHSGVNYRFQIESHEVSLLAVPLVLHGRTIGVLGCAMLADGAAFGIEKIRLMETVANLAAVRVEQARLLASARQRAVELSTLYTISLEISRQHQLTAVLQDIVESSVLLLKADGGKLFLSSPELQIVNCAASSNVPEVQVNEVLHYGEGAAGKVAQNGQTLMVNKYAEWPGRSPAYENCWRPTSLLSVPILWQDQVTGVIQVFRGSDQAFFQAGDQELLVLFASQAATALENSRLYARLQHQAITDELTGVYNRRGLFELGRREVERSRRYHQVLSAILFDIDHFKLVNDRFGHAVGDQLLAALGQCCLHSVREVDLVGRYGGEEFVVLLPQSDLPVAQQIAERIRSLVSQIFIPTTSGESAHATISMGVTMLVETDTELDALLVRADNAMYAAKNAGRNRIVVF